jgi:hypothetical protein
MEPSDAKTSRFVDTASDPLEARIGNVLRQLAPPEPLRAVELARVRARLVPPSRAAVQPIRYAALLATGMLAGTGFAVASYGVQRLAQAPSRPPHVVAAAPEAPKAKTSSAPRQEKQTPASEAVPPPEASKPSTAAFPETSSGALGRESELLARALSTLRRNRDATGALSLLDEHARSFPNGALKVEADLARLDALLALGRNDEALSLLVRLPIDRVGRGAELRVIRGELFARRDPQNAIADFNRALSSGLSRDLEERALFGRAASRLRAGDETGGRADLAAYLAKYPNGRFSEQARRF